ncbi:MAG: HigA family addiction module antitoxin [Rickettsiales bacterium]
MSRLQNVHAGEVLLEDFLKPMEISQNALAKAIAVSPRRINEIVLKKRAITPDTAIRLSKFFGTSVKFWIGLQADYDIEEAELSYNYKKIRPLSETDYTV